MQLKSTFLRKYVPDRYKSQEKWDKIILENAGFLMFVPDYYKDQNVCNKVVHSNILMYYDLFPPVVRPKNV